MASTASASGACWVNSGVDDKDADDVPGASLFWFVAAVFEWPDDVMNAFVQKSDFGSIHIDDNGDANIEIKAVTFRQKHFEKYCRGWLSEEQLPRGKQLYEPVKRYTSSKEATGPVNDMFYAKLNLALALDIEEVLEFEKDYIQKLQFCITALPGYQSDQPLYRGMNLSEKEVQDIKNSGEFYFPGFTSTSVINPFTENNNPFAQPGNLLLEIDASDGERLTLNIASSPVRHQLSKYPESEVLISCYSRFKFMGETKGPRGVTVLKLKLLDPAHEHYDKLDMYEAARNGDWKDLFKEIDANVHKAQVMVRYARPESGWTVLHQAAWWGDQDIVNEFMRLGADPNRRSIKDQKTAKEIISPFGVIIDWEEAEAEAEKVRPFRAGKWPGQ